jgi:Predicted nucleotide-binding protein containing TIR-like domain
MQKRVFVSSTNNKSLDDRRRLLKASILNKIREAGYEPQEFWESGVPENLGWSFESVDHVMRMCVGAVVFGFPRWTISEPSFETRLVGEYNHYEGAVALTHGLPVLLLAENGVENRGVVWTGGGKTITFLPEDADEAWVASPDFTKRFKAWLREVGARKDVFLGYCSKSAGTAAQIQLHLEKLDATVLNWAMDFRAGGSILDEIENARAACSCGIFLFSEDDPLEGTPGGAAPRDNVVFEAGYFMSSKGPERCLIVRQGEAKMPADLGGGIYVNLPKAADVSSIEGRLRDFLARNL